MKSTPELPDGLPGLPIAHTILTKAQAQELRLALTLAGIALSEDLDAALPPLDQMPEDDGRRAVTVRIARRHMEYLTARAAQHNEPVARHIETILREFRAHHDTRRPDQQIPPAAPGAPVLARRG